MGWAGPSKKRVKDRPAVEFDNHLKLYRSLYKLTQYELAAQVGISYNTLYQIERRLLMPKLDTAVHLARYFKISVNELFFTPGESVPVRLPAGMTAKEFSDSIPPKEQ